MFKLDALNNPLTSSLISGVAEKITGNADGNSVTELIGAFTNGSSVSQEKSGLIESFFSSAGKNIDPSTIMDTFSSFVHDSKKQDAENVAAGTNLSADSVLNFLNASLAKGNLDFNGSSFGELVSAINPMADSDHDGENNLKETLTALFAKYSNQ